MTDHKHADVEAIKAIKNTIPIDQYRNTWPTITIDIINAYRQFLNENGFAIMPREPTEIMVRSAREHHEGEPYLPHSLYKAMIAAYEAERAGE